MEKILKCAKLKIRIDELQRKRELDSNRFKSYAVRKEKEVDELEHELRKSNQKKEFMRYTTKQHNDEHEEFMSNAYAQTFTQNIQLRDWVNTTTSNLNDRSNELRLTRQQFDEYRKKAVENQATLIDSHQKIALENEQIRLQLAELVRPKDEKVGPNFPQEILETDFKSSNKSLDNVKMEKESSNKKKKKSSKKEKKKRKQQSRVENKEDKSPTTTKGVRTNTSDSGLDEKMAPLGPGFADSFRQLDDMMKNIPNQSFSSELFYPANNDITDDAIPRVPSQYTLWR